MTNKENYYFIGQCLALRVGGDKDAVRSVLKSDDVDWENFAYTASNHLVLTSIFVIFRELDFLKFVPAELLVQMEKLYDINYKRNEQIIDQIEEITSGLNKVGVYPIFLKGSGNLIDGLYEDLGERIMSDIDFLVSPNEFEKTIEFLENESFLIDNYYEKYHLKKAFHHYPRMFKEGAFDIEVHRAPVKFVYSKHFDFLVVDGTKKKLSLLEKTCFVESYENMVIHNFIHGQLVDYGFIVGQINLRNAYDLLLLSQKVNIDIVLKQFHHYKFSANAYWSVVRSFIKSKETFTQKVELYSRLFRFRLDLSLSSKGYSKINSLITYPYILLKVRFFAQLVNGIENHDVLKSMWLRIINLNWYQNKYTEKNKNKSL